jgi:peptidoglycan-associated lipoprotein
VAARSPQQTDSANGALEKGGIMMSRCRNGIVVSLLITAVILAGCAKRPAMTATSAPAPSGAAQATTPAPTPAPGAAATTPPSSATPQGAKPAPAAPGMAAKPPAPGTAAPTARPPVQEFAANPNLKDIHFDFDKYDIRPGDAKVLDANATWLKGNNNLVLIEGHCDERGTNEYNLALGERRAKAAMNYLVSQGVQAGRITIISYGEERPLCTEHNEACWAKNRRAHFLTKAR